MESHEDEGPSVPQELNRRHMLMGGAMLATAGFAWVRQPQEVVARLAPDAFEQMVPSRLGHWTFYSKSGLVLPTEDKLSESLYNQVLTRVYTAPNQAPMMLLIAYSSTQNGMLQLHRPEICYPASGMQLSETETSSVEINPRQILPIRRFSAHSDTRTEQVLYWTRIGDKHPTSWAQQRLAVVRANLRQAIPDGILVRVSTFSNSYEASKPDIEQFVRALVTASPPPLRHLLIGNLGGAD